MCLESGADDVYCQAFFLTVLKARVSALFRRYNTGQDAGRLLMSGDISIDEAAMKAYKGDRALD